MERTENGQEDGDKYQQFDLPWSTYRIVRRISTAKIVSGQIGTVEFTLSPTAILQTAALYNGMPKRKSNPNVLYDKEDNISMIETVETDTTDLKNLKYLDFAADYKYPGRVQGKSITPRISLIFVTNPPIKDHRPLELKLWIDGKLADTFTATYKNEDNNERGTFQLYNISEKAMRVIELIAAANTAKCSLGNMEFSLPSETISQIKLLWTGMHLKW